METAPRPYIDLYAAAWPTDKRNTPPMAEERSRVRSGVIAVLAQQPGTDDDFSADERVAVQWQGVALALVDVLSPETLLEVLNILPGAFGGALKATVTAARIADFKGIDRGHVPLRSPAREEEDGLPPLPDFLKDRGDAARVRELEGHVRAMILAGAPLRRWAEKDMRNESSRVSAMEQKETPVGDAIKAFDDALAEAMKCVGGKVR
jgi:hypothetical protein